MRLEVLGYSFAHPCSLCKLGAHTSKFLYEELTAKLLVTYTFLFSILIEQSKEIAAMPVQKGAFKLRLCPVWCIDVLDDNKRGTEVHKTEILKFVRVPPSWVRQFCRTVGHAHLAELILVTATIQRVFLVQHKNFIYERCNCCCGQHPCD